MGQILNEQKKDGKQKDILLRSNTITDIRLKNVPSPALQTRVSAKEKKSGSLKPAEGDVLVENQQILLQDRTEQNTSAMGRVSMPYLSRVREQAPANKEASEAARLEETLLKKEAMRKTIREFAISFRNNEDAFNSRFAAGKEEDNSESFVDLRNAYNEARGLCASVISDTEPFPVSDAVQVFTHLIEASENYYALHRGRRNTSLGRDRKALALTLKREMRSVFRKLNGLSGVDAANAQTEAREYTKKEKKGSEETMEELVKYYDKWRKHIARNASCSTPEENLQDRLGMLLAYERDMQVYIATHEKKKWPKEIAAVIQEARSVHAQGQLILWTRKHEQKNQHHLGEIHSIIRRHVEEADERNAEQTLSEEEIDRDLTKEQLAGIAAIDQWLVRNFNNGGVIRGIPKFRNHNGDFVSSLLQKTKRERLHIYYLVEKKARKHPNRLDIGLSQTDYIPDLSAFKEQMLATRWKVISHLTGRYVYMHKLSEAVQITEEYQQDIKSSCLITKHLAEDRKKTKAELGGPAEERMYFLGQFYEEMGQYKKLLQQCEKAKGEKRTRLEEQAKEAAKKAQLSLRALVHADHSLAEKAEKSDLLTGNTEKKVDIQNRENKNEVDRAKYTGYALSGMKFASGNIDTVLGKGTSWFHTEWGLSDQGWADLELWTGNVTTSLACAGSLVAAGFSIYCLTKKWGSTGEPERAEKVLGIVKTAGSMVTTIWKGVNHAEKAKNYADIALGRSVEAAKNVTKASPALYWTGVGVAGVGVVVSTAKWAGIAKQSINASSAKKYFDRKHQAQRQNVPAGELTEEGRKRRRQEKYEKGMLKLTDNLRSKNKLSAAMSTMGTALSVTGVLVPGIGTITMLVGMALSVTASILNAVKLGGVKKAMFDHYFNMDELFEKVKAYKEKAGWRFKSDKDMKSRLRRRAAAAAGFASMGAAADQIAKKYAEQVYEKLFGPDATNDMEEKNGYIDLVKSFGLKYNEEKKKPTLQALKLKMTGR